MIIIKFLEDAPNLDEVATKAQAETYRLIKASLSTGQKVTVDDILNRLGLRNPKCLFSRLNNLQRKGFIEWGKSQMATT